MAPPPRVPWRERLAVPVSEVAELFDTSPKSVYRLIYDWAFGDPSKLPSTGSSKPRIKIPPARIQAYLDGDRQYPPGDPRGQKHDDAPATV